MRLGRVATPSGVAFVSVDGVDEEGATAASGTPAAGVPAGATVREIAEHPFGDPTYTGRSWPLADVRVLAPILASKVICVGKNYAAHAAEMGGVAPADPVIFLKPNTSIIGPGAPIVRPKGAERVDYEGELAVVIGRPCRNVPARSAADVILGYTIANDVTERAQQKADGQWTRGKGYDTFCPLGPWIETALDPGDLRISTSVNGAIRQDGRTSDLLHDIPSIIEWISAVMTLLPGDVILTGTPEGVGPVVAGDTVSVSIEGIGTLSNPVEDAK
ncbi:fumarylacetoacetate hydrolase family protein [Millisia brevis]|uniref:fumarylacetoacetate hydrolase family protein n=1 Tax=Millisia brevis TaxID=264148 RepID=UPI0008297294|nr:fumarylacetoacetate hydrolase family protein [Millisia brevis]